MDSEIRDIVIVISGFSIVFAWLVHDFVRWIRRRRWERGNYSPKDILEANIAQLIRELSRRIQKREFGSYEDLVEEQNRIAQKLGFMSYREPQKKVGVATALGFDSYDLKKQFEEVVRERECQLERERKEQEKKERQRQQQEFRSGYMPAGVKGVGWARDQVKGWIYVLSNKAMPGLVKVGYSLKDPKLRAKELDGTGLPYPPAVVYEMLVYDPQKIEEKVHKALSDCREGKEWFRCEVEETIELIRQIAGNKAIIESAKE